MVNHKKDNTATLPTNQQNLENSMDTGISRPPGLFSLWAPLGRGLPPHGDYRRRHGRMADVTPHIRDHRERQERHEASAEEAEAILSQRREILDEAETIAAYPRA